MPRYRAYGLEIDSDRRLPFGDGSAAAERDLRISYAGRSDISRSGEPLRRELIRGADGWTLLYVDGDGGWISYDYREADAALVVSDNVGWEHCVGPLVGVVLAVLLRLGGATLLHGAGLSVAGRAVAILGASGAGKSTLAAALVARGAALLSEDLLVVARGADGPAIEAGVLRLSLLEDASAALGAEEQGVDRRLSVPKYLVGCGDGGGSSAPLAAICVLEPLGAAAQVAAERLSGFAAMAAVAEHLYGVGWITPTDATDLGFCARLAARVPVVRLTRPRALGRLGESADLLIGQLAEQVE